MPIPHGHDIAVTRHVTLVRVFIARLGRRLASTLGAALMVAAHAAEPSAAAVLDDASLALAQRSARELVAGRTAAAAALAQQAKLARLSAEDAAAWHCRRGLWLIRAGRPRLAEQEYLAARQLVPADTETLAGLAHTALLLQRRGDAEKLHALARQPFGDAPPMNDIYAPGKQHLNLVGALLDNSLSRFDAERFFTMELKGDAFYYAGRTEELSGHLEEAEALYRAALGEVPEDFAVARSALAKVAGAGRGPALLEPQDANLGRLRQYVELCLQQDDLTGAERIGAQLVARGRDWPTFVDRQRLWARVQAACFLASGGRALAHGARALALFAECDDGAPEITALRARVWKELGAADPEWFRQLSPSPHAGVPDAVVAAALRSWVTSDSLREADPRLDEVEAIWTKSWGAGPEAEVLRDETKRRNCADRARVGAEIALLRRLAAKAGSAEQARARHDAGERLLISLWLEPEDLARVRAVREHPDAAALGLDFGEGGALSKGLRAVPAYQLMADEMLPLAEVTFALSLSPALGRAFCDRLFAVLATEMPPAADAPWREELVRTVWRLTRDPVRCGDVLDWAVQSERGFGPPIHLDWLPSEMWESPFGRAYLDAETWLMRLRGDPAKFPASVMDFSTAPSLQCRMLQAKWMRSGDVVLWANDTVGILRQFQGRNLSPSLLTSRTAFIGRLLDRLEIECVDILLMPGESNAVSRPNQTSGETMQNVARGTQDRELLGQLKPLLQDIEVPVYVQRGIDERFAKLGAWVALRLGDEAGIKQSPLVWHEYSVRQARFKAEENARAKLAEWEEAERMRLLRKADAERKNAVGQTRAIAALQSLTERVRVFLARGEIDAAKAALAKVRGNPDVRTHFSTELERMAESLDSVDRAWTAQARIAQQNLLEHETAAPAYVPRQLSPEMQQLFEITGLDGRGAERLRTIKR